jgi:hypothetical protein
MRSSGKEFNMAKLKDRKVDDPQLDGQDLLQVHLAEYQALTNRCSYWITVQVALLPLFLIVIGIVCQVWGGPIDKRLLTLGSTAIVQLIIMGYLHISLEIYQAVCYMECELRPLLRATVNGSNKFWHYEAFLAQRRRKGPIWEEYILPLCDLIGIIFLTVYTFSSHAVIDYIGLSLNLTLLVLIFTDTWKLVSLRRRYTQCTLSVAGDHE